MPRGEGPTVALWEPRPPASTEAMITMAIHELFLLRFLAI